MVTLAKLCLVMTVVLGLAFAEPRPSWSRSLDTGDKCKEIGRYCSQDQECCGRHCELQCQKSEGGKCSRKCSDCKHENDICRTNGDCCSNQCAPDRFDPSKYTCTYEEPSLKTRSNRGSYKTMPVETGDPENEGEISSRSKGQLLECPQAATDLTGVSSLQIPDVMSWSQCGDICKCLPATVCQFWTWEKTAHLCHIKTDMGIAHDRAGQTSGSRGCVGKK